MEIIYEKDDSIYFVFPRRKQFVLDSISEKKFYKCDYKEVKREFKNLCKKYKNPKVSFHPGKMVVHVNSFNNHVKEDHKIYNAINNKYGLLCYLVQVVFPIDLSIFDEYNKVNNDSLIINCDNSDISGDKNISLEIFIHSSNIEINEDVLPVFKRDFKYMFTYNSGFDYSVTVSVSKLDSKNNDCIILNINTLDRSIIYTLKP
jgi:hypothetical protein